MMEDLFQNTVGQSLLCGAIFIIVAIVMYTFPPKKINNFYGYRTGSSMKSQEHWDFSQKYASIQMAKAGMLMILLSFLGKLYPLEENVYQTAASIVIALAATIFLLLSTEKAIKKRFEKS